MQIVNFIDNCFARGQEHSIVAAQLRLYDVSYCTVGSFVFKIYSRRKQSVATRRDWFLELFLGSVSELIMLLLFFVVIYFNAKKTNCLIIRWTACGVVKRIWILQCA